MDIIKRNFIHLICSGALNQYVSLEPMSVYKWKRLAYLFTQQHLSSIALKGLKNHQFDTNINIPFEVVKILEDQSKNELNNLPSFPRLANPRLNKRLKKIIHHEQHSIDTSIETIQILNILIYNVNHILNFGLSLRGIIDLGHYLRTSGDKVDFVKLDRWLDQLSMKRMAQLQGSILISVFKFDLDEIPFVHQLEENAVSLAMLSLSHLQIDSSDEWHFKQSKTGFVRNNNAVMKKSLRRSMRYINYAPIETISNLIFNFAKGLSEIEE